MPHGSSSSAQPAHLHAITVRSSPASLSSGLVENWLSGETGPIRSRWRGMSSRAGQSRHAGSGRFIELAEVPVGANCEVELLVQLRARAREPYADPSWLAQACEPTEREPGRALRLAGASPTVRAVVAARVSRAELCEYPRTEGIAHLCGRATRVRALRTSVFTAIAWWSSTGSRVGAEPAASAPVTSSTVAVAGAVRRFTPGRASPPPSSTRPSSTAPRGSCAIRSPSPSRTTSSGCNGDRAGPCPGRGPPSGRSLATAP